MLVPNYTGDRLNFGLSFEKVKKEQPNLKIEMLVVGEDCASLPSVQSAGRRGLCGQVFANKVGKTGFFSPSIKPAVRLHQFPNPTLTFALNNLSQLPPINDFVDNSTVVSPYPIGNG